MIDFETAGSMLGRRRIRTACITWLAVSLALANRGLATALDDYVATPDSHYTFSLVGSSQFDGSTYTTGYVLDLTSQAWRTQTEVDQPLWHHWLTVIVPEHYLFAPPVKDTALLLIEGGDTADPPIAFDLQLRQLSAATRTVVVRVSAVPNQPMLFTDEASPRSEDEIIAYSWNKYFATGDPTWIVQLPMVKAVVRAMDATKSFVGGTNGYGINRFVLVGGSKRGWTAWLTAAVDPRIRAICPIVSDLLNMPVSFAHHWASYGFWAEALSPYEELGIFDRLGTDEGTKLLQIVDPYAYRDRLTMPKFIINAAGDDFFVSDSARFYINDLAGETYLRHVPNTDHYLTGAYDQIVNCTIPYYDAVLNSYQRPRFSWTIQADGSIRVEMVDPPKSVTLWQATNPSTRDFRLTTIGAAWTGSALSNLGDGVYVGQVPAPSAGWTAFFVELVYSNPFSQQYSPNGDFDYHFTTEMQVLPKAMPFPEVMLAPVHRFWSSQGGRHFYTISPYEKSFVQSRYPDYWAYETVGYYAYLSECDWGLRPVYRFWSDRYTAHFYTIDESERDYVLATYPGIWTYEGAVFYAYPEGQQPDGTRPVYRFWSPVLGCHFYTIDDAERDYVLATWPDTWTYEGIAWYAYDAAE
ncbi:MAG: hypothetical protein JW993_12790 [Sedimentisphaerales bacterium]|nr:hypothetical protein [Sedimentisphaerales bacterium]